MLLSPVDGKKASRALSDIFNQARWAKLSNSCSILDTAGIILKAIAEQVPPVMSSTQQIDTLYGGGLVQVLDVCCRPNCRGCSEEKYATNHLLVLPRAGFSVRHRARREEFVLDSTRLLFINGGEASRFSHPVLGGDDYTVLAFRREALEAFLRTNDPATADRAPGKPFVRPEAPASPKTALLLQRLRQHLLLGPATFDPLAVEETAASLLTSSLHAAGTLPVPTGRRADTRRAHRELAGRARLMLAANFRERMTLEELARQVFSSPFHLARIYRQQTGGSIHGYVLRLRLQAALERVVADGKADLTTLALDSGFASHAHFSDAFRRTFGIAPSALRRRASAQLLKKMRQKLPCVAA